MRYIPRSLTSYILRQPPRVLIGHKVLDWTVKDYNCGKEIIDWNYDKKKWMSPYTHDLRKGANPCQRHKWSFHFSLPLYFTLTLPSGWYIRIGCRWDDNDDYYNIISFMIKKIKLKEDVLKIEYKGIWREWEYDG